MDKAILRAAVVAQLTRELDLQSRAALESRAEATNEESKSEHKYDMRGQEAAYLAEGQAKLATDLMEAIQIYQTLELPAFGAASAIALGAVVTLDARGRTTRYFIGPRNGGAELEAGGETFTLVTPVSPLGRQLIGKRAGDTVHLPGRPQPIAHKILDVS